MVDFAAAGLLDGVDDESDRAARSELLEQLHTAGVSLEDLRAAVDEDRLALLPVELVLGGEGRYTVAEVAEQTGLQERFLLAQRRALGLPLPEEGDRAFTEDDLEAARRTELYRKAGFADAQQIEIARVIGDSMARVAETIRVAVGESLSKPGDTERDLGLRIADMASEMTPMLGSLLEYVLSLHLREQTRRNVVTRAEVATGSLLPGSRTVAVCFADLVGFTRLGSELPVEELGAVAGRLAEMAGAVAQPPVRLIKTIGDAAMLVSPEPDALLDASLTLVQAADEEGEQFPQLRAGISLGPALNRGGDWYGHTVNLASRVTAIARPGSVLVAEDAQEALQDGPYQWSFAGEHRLRGIERPVKLFRARTAEPAPEDAAGEASGEDAGAR